MCVSGGGGGCAMSVGTNKHVNYFVALETPPGHHQLDNSRI